MSKRERSLKLEACRNLKTQLIDDIRSRNPFREQKGADISKAKVSAYIKLLKRLKKLMKDEEDLWDD